ncbi:MAG: DUF3088 domain-containing protein [Proteobacteria bacterium]|nr:DUF3088 domain-containing protein [Pseudomonadota bacterium]
MLDILFLFKPGFIDGNARWFCPYSAQVVGFLTYFHEVRSTLDVREIDFPKPRKEIVEMIGEEFQSLPLLILAKRSPIPKEFENDVVTARGHRIITDTKVILRYLATTRNLPLPH